MGTKQTPTQLQRRSESSKDYFIGLWEDHVGSTKPWEGKRLIHLNITLTLMLSATLKGVVPSSKGQSRSKWQFYRKTRQALPV